MKILTTESGKIIAFGAFVFAQKDESVIETDDTTIAVLKELAKVNKIEITSKKKDDVISEINAHMVEHNTEVSEMSDTEKFEQIVVDGFAKEKTDNDMKKELFEAGCEFGDINKVFNAAIVKHALRMSAKDRNTKTAEFLEGYAPETDDVEGHLSKISALQDHLGSSSTQAGASMRKWAKDNEIELPKAPEAPKVVGFRGNQKVVADWALENKDATFEQMVKFAEDNIEKTKGGKDNSRGYAIAVWNAVLFAKSYTGEPEAEVAQEETEEMA
ncbi:MAG: hypothetical protein ACTSQB_00330 [Candidatus Heimdallarchaeota archaeon]